MRTRRYIRTVAAASVCLFVCGCQVELVAGRVVSSQGEALPGVAVSVEGTRRQAVSDAHGEYNKLACRPGKVVLSFSKTGYAPARLELAVGSVGRTEAETVSLWRLPRDKGVYLLERGQYIAVAGQEAELFTLPDGASVHGVKHAPRVATRETMPDIVCYRMTPYDVRVSRLERQAVAPGPKTLPGQEVWVRVGDIPATMGPLDEPEGLLYQVYYAGPLGPGVYAVHWGALGGYTTLDSRAFCFEVAGAAHVEEASVEPKPEGEGDKRDTD